MFTIEEDFPGKQLLSFYDHHGHECSLQISTVSEEEAIWLGCNDLGLSRYVPGSGWQKMDVPGSDVKGNTRMHLTRDQVSALLPILSKFANEGLLVDKK